MQIQCTVIIWVKILNAKKDYKWHNALFLWLGCFRLNAALLIHFNDIILENKNKYCQKRGVIPLCKFCNNLFNLFSVFLPERLYKQLIFWGGHIRDFLLSITEKWTTFGEFHTTLTRSGQFTMPPICYLALTAKYMKIIFF